MPTRMENGLKTLVLALHHEALLTASAKGLSGPLAELAALRETASLATPAAGRPLGEEEVLRIVLAARRLRNHIRVTPKVPAIPPLSPVLSAARQRRGRLAVWAMRSLARHPSVALV